MTALHDSALLVLADGSSFHGRAIGARGRAVGEVVFNTAMSGYQEILTDPSYAQQIITFTYPHIGNVGVNEEDMESDRCWVKGAVIRDLPFIASNFRSQGNLDDFLEAQGVVGIAEIDTRRLTRLLREKGSLDGCILSGDALSAEGNAESACAQAAQAFPGLAGMDLAREVSCAESYGWREGVWRLGEGHPIREGGRFKVVAYDFGIKRNILRILADLECDVTVVPAQTPAAEVLAMQPDGVFLSNGPGDPEPCTYAIEATKTLIDADLPVFGICLGYQIMALASGAQTVKMTHGHHGANHPVKDLDAERVLITSQNHGFAVDDRALPDCLRRTHASLFDGSLQGLARIDKPVYGMQGHPEASPGPQDARYLFQPFIDAMAAANASAS